MGVDADPEARRAVTRLAYLVHVYTATGAVCALMALIAIDAFDYRLALIWLVVATFVDATDGWLARLARVDRHANLFDGARIDDIVDYTTYVLVPGVMLLHAGRLPGGWIGVTVVSGMLLASALGFARRDAKTTAATTADYFFTGFPSYWNIVALYVLAADVSPEVTAVVVAALSVLVFVPIRFVYPSRTKTLQPLNVVGCAVWAVQVLLMIWWMPDVPAWLLWTSAIYPAYYVALSLVLSARRR
jgi:phosphatidylcholine synthase